MKSYLALVLAISCAVLVSAADDDQKCKNDFVTFLGCVKEQHEKVSDSDKAAAKQARQDSADDCFVTAKCEKPDWATDPAGGLGGKHMGGMNMSKAVKDCLKKKIIEKVGAKLNDCLTKKGVKNLNFSAFADSMGDGFGMEGHGDDAKEGIQVSMKAKFTAIKAVDKCAAGDTQSQTVKTLEQCLHNIKKADKPKMCALTKPCEAKVSSDCKQRGEDIRKALCQCKKEKEGEVAKKLRALGEQQKTVGIPDLMKTISDDLDLKDIMSQVDVCYQENNEKPPPMLKVAMQMMSGQGGSNPLTAKLSSAMSVSGTQVVIMADMMTLDAEDDTECKPCP